MIEVHDIRGMFRRKLATNEFVTDKTGVKTIEIVGQSFVADQEAIFGEVNRDYVQRELDWYNSKSLNINDIKPPIPKAWIGAADPHGNINSNYGWVMFSKENGYQYLKVQIELNRNRDSRRAIAIYNRPSMHEDYNKNGMSDFMCTNAVQYLIREDVLIAIVQMRSNDAVFGYKNDRAWQDHIAENLQEVLNCKSRKIIWNAGSLHVYSKHFHLV